MKKIFISILSLVLIFTSLVPAFAAASYTYTPPEWFAENEETYDDMIMWMADDKATNANLIIYENTDEFFVSALTNTDMKTLADNMETNIAEGYKGNGVEIADVKLVDYKKTKFNGLDCFTFTLDSSIGVSEDQVMNMEQKFYTFSSKENVYYFTLTTNEMSSYTAADFEEAFSTFSIKEEMPGFLEKINFSSGNVVIYTLIGGLAGALIGTILSVIAKKKKKQTEQEQPASLTDGFPTPKNTEGQDDM